MTNPSTHQTEAEPELTLDPDDWNGLREIAHRALDQMLDFQMTVREKPVWQVVPQSTEALLAEPAPHKGLGPVAVVEEMLQHIVPFPAGHAHPRFWGWVTGTGTPIGMLADMLAAGVNASAGTFNDAPSRVELQLLSWMRDLFEFPAAASGIVTSGASVANIIGLAVGRDVILQGDVRQKGLVKMKGTPTVYASTQVHSSVDKAMQLLGLGLENLRRVPVNAAYEMRVDLLESMIEKDRREGRVPIAVVASAGTVNTGAMDDLGAISDLTRRYGIWFHVDGAIGALAAMSANLKPRLRGLEQADSIAFDFHKWLYVPYEAGCVLVRDGVAHRKSFSAAASYLEAPPRGIAAMHDTSNTRGPQLSRGFKALKVWAQIREFGFEKLGRLHDQNVAHIQYLARLVDEAPDLERLAPAPMNILCFRYLPQTLPESATDEINQELLMQLQEKGIAAPSSTRLEGRFALRVANTNHRSRRSDFELLVREVKRLGVEIEAKLGNQRAG